jgi:hypothetical protein
LVDVGGTVCPQLDDAENVEKYRCYNNGNFFVYAVLPGKDAVFVHERKSNAECSRVEQVCGW